MATLPGPAATASAASIAKAPASSWAPNPAAVEQHFRLYAAANLIDVDRWHRERPHVAAGRGSTPERQP